MNLNAIKRYYEIYIPDCPVKKEDHKNKYQTINSPSCSPVDSTPCADFISKSPVVKSSEGSENTEDHCVADKSLLDASSSHSNTEHDKEEECSQPQKVHT